MFLTRQRLETAMLWYELLFRLGIEAICMTPVQHSLPSMSFSFRLMSTHSTIVVSGTAVAVIEEATASVCVRLWPLTSVNVTTMECTSTGEALETAVSKRNHH